MDAVKTLSTKGQMAKAANIEESHPKCLDLDAVKTLSTKGRTVSNATLADATLVFWI